MNSNKVSVVIPVRDRADTIVESVLSVLNQSYSNVEVVVVENGSHDPEAVLQAVKSINDERVKVISITGCRNGNQARNVGVKASSGEIIAFLDSDDTYLESHLAEGVSILEDEDLDFVYGSVEISDGEKTWIVNSRPLHEGESPANYFFDGSNSFAPTPSYICRRKVFEKVSWDENLERHQDFDFFISVNLNFQSFSKVAPAARVNWVKGERRFYSGTSMVYFYRKWRSYMAEEVKVRYVLRRAVLAIRNYDFIRFFYFGFASFVNVFLCFLRKK